MNCYKVSSLYIHFPFCKHLCNYCDFYKRQSNVGSSEVKWFQDKLIKSTEKLLQFYKSKNFKIARLKSVYIGGGTPSLWGQLGAQWFSHFLEQMQLELESDCEFTMEMNPGSLTGELIQSWQNSGLNRVSVGIQTLNDSGLAVLDRIHSVCDSINALETLQGLGINFSTDFMIGIPQTGQARNIRLELEEVLKYDPNHLSLYIFTVGKKYKHFSLIPSEQVVSDEYLDVANFLKTKGYIHYEVSNFAKSNDESRHNLTYWKSGPVLAIGPSATGFMCFEESALRYKWDTSMENFSVEKLDASQLRLEKLYMLLRTNLGVSKSFGEGESWSNLVQDWSRRELLSCDGDIISLNSRGYLVIDSLMDEIFSRTKVL